MRDSNTTITSLICICSNHRPFQLINPEQKKTSNMVYLAIYQNHHSLCLPVSVDISAYNHIYLGLYTCEYFISNNWQFNSGNINILKALGYNLHLKLLVGQICLLGLGDFQTQHCFILIKIVYQLNCMTNQRKNKLISF